MGARKLNEDAKSVLSDSEIAYLVKSWKSAFKSGNERRQEYYSQAIGDRLLILLGELPEDDEEDLNYRKKEQRTVKSRTANEILTEMRQRERKPLKEDERMRDDFTSLRSTIGKVLAKYGIKGSFMSDIAAILRKAEGRDINK